MLKMRLAGVLNDKITASPRPPPVGARPILGHVHISRAQKSLMENPASAPDTGNETYKKSIFA